MNEMIHSGAVKFIEGYDAPIYLIKEESDFSITEYKMMGNINSLLRCRKASLDGDLQLIYLNDGYSPLSLVISHFTKDKLAQTIDNICDAFLEIRNNGFMHCNSVVLKPEAVYANPSTQAIKLVYIPITDSNIHNSFTVAALNDFFVTLIRGIDLADAKLIEAANLFGLNNPEASLEDVKNFYNRTLGHNLTNDKTKSASVKNRGNNSILRLRSRIKSVNADFVVNQDRFVLGKKKSVVDGAFPNDPTLGISRVHCEILREGQRYFVSDLGSLNGTFVNNTKLSPGDREELHNNDTLRLSNIVLSVKITEG